MRVAQTGTPTVTLVNRSRRAQVFNLPYKIAGLQYCVRQLCGRVVYDGSTGAKRVKGENKRLSDSLTLMGRGTEGDTVRQLPPAVLECPEIKTALNARPPTLRAFHLNAEESAKEAEQLRSADAARAEAKTRQATFLRNKAERKAAHAMARAAAAAAKAAPPSEEEKKRLAAEKKRLAEAEAAAKKAAEEAAADAPEGEGGEPDGKSGKGGRGKK